MAWCSSARERRLWIVILVLVTTIYSTLWLTQKLAAFLAGSGLDVAGFLLSMFLIAVAVAILALRVRPGGIEIGVMIGIAAVYVMVLVRLSLAERTHLIEYGIIAALIHEVLIERRNNGRTVPVPALLAIVLATLIGTVDELIQKLLPNRYFHTEDILFNALAATMAVGARVVLGWVRAFVDRLRRARRNE